MITNRMGWIRLLPAFAFLAVMGWVSLRLLIDPVGWRDFFDRRGWWIGLMTYTESKWGRLQLRVLSGVLLVFILIAFLVILLQELDPGAFRRASLL